MARVYWIEDEAKLLKGTRQFLEDKVGLGGVVTLGTAFAGRKAIEQIQADHAPIILDLWLPSGDPSLPSEQQTGPEVGLRLLRELRTYLGKSWPIFIVSGNMTFPIKEDLIDKLGVPSEWIFAKALSEAESNELVRMVARAVGAPGGAPPD